jgi:uncharacterized protein
MNPPSPNPSDRSPEAVPDPKPLPKVTCPTCRQRGDWFSTRWGPFCSERCRWVDLGKWLGEEHRFTAPLTAADLDGYDEPLGPSDSIHDREQNRST